MAYTEQEITANLIAMKLPVPPVDILEEVLDIEGFDMISRAIDATKVGKVKAEKYLRGIFYAVAAGTKERLARRQMTALPVPILVAIGKNEGPDFALRLKAWDDEGGAEGDDARFVRLSVARHLQAARNVINQQQPACEGHSGTRQCAISRPTERSAQGGSVHQFPQARQGQEMDDAPEAQGTAEESDPNERDLRSVRVYGGKSAACFSADKARSGTYTVRIEAAESNGSRSYDWKGKVAIQLSSREMPLVLATLMQWMGKIEGKGHGVNSEKWFTLENQPGKLYLSVSSKGCGSRGIPIMAGDAYSITTLLIRQMLKNDPFLSVESLLAITRKQAEIANGQGVAQPQRWQQKTA
jgi:hypothetical protein